MTSNLLLVLLPCLLQTCLGYPQYQVPKVGSEIPSEAAGGSVLTGDKKKATNPFWWKVDGTFAGLGADSPGVQAKNPCAEGLDCVPWQSCINGIINQRGEFSLDLRTKPANYRSLACEPDGHMCCGIPPELINQEQKPVGGGVDIGVDAEKITSGAAGAELTSGAEGQITSAGHAGQIPPVGYGASGVDGGELAPGVVGEITSSADGGQISGVDGEKQQTGLDGGGVPSIAVGGKLTPELEGEVLTSVIDGETLTSVGDGGVSVSAGVDVDAEYELPSVCEDLRYDCVPFFQCKKGVISTDGEGVLDERTKPPASCINSEAPTITAVCCLKPGETPPVPPVDACSSTEECIDNSLCGVVTSTDKSDGTGIIQIRSSLTACYKADKSVGVCCIPPKKPAILDICPGDSICMSGIDCLGKAADEIGNFVDYVPGGSWTSCVGAYENAVCCIQPPPPVLEVCPGNSACLSGYECLGQAVDGSGNVVDYVPDGTWSSCVGDYENAVCCIQPPAPIINVCTGGSICLPLGACKGQALDNTGKFISYNSKGSWKYCSEGGYDSGICCINPSDATLTPAGKCGIRNYDIDKRIQSNNAENEASFGEFPWQAIIFNKTYHFECGASLISTAHVITAAHCVYDHTPSNIRVRFGEWQVNKFDEKLPYVDRNIKKIIMHPGYNGEVKNYFNDIAIIELDKPVELKYHINTICTSKNIPAPGTTCFASGWGKDAFKGKFQHKLKKIDLPFVDHASCEALLRKTRLGKYFKLHESFLCAGGEENKDACYGDGGGPLACKDPVTEQYFLTGITAWGIGCGTKNVPGVYANVPEFYDWIDQTLLGDVQDQEQIPSYSGK